MEERSGTLRYQAVSVILLMLCISSLRLFGQNNAMVAGTDSMSFSSKTQINPWRGYSTANDSGCSYTSKAGTFSGFLKSLEQLKKELAESEKYGSENINSAFYYHAIASLYDGHREYDTALYYYGRELAIYKKLPVAYSSFSSRAYMAIAEIYKANRQYDKALEYYIRDMVMEEKLIGKDNSHTTDSVIVNGNVYESSDLVNVYDSTSSVCLEIGDYDGALRFCGKALTIQEKRFGKEDLNTAVYYCKTGDIYFYEGDYPQAIDYYNMALTIDEKTANMEYTCRGLYVNIAACYILKGEKEKRSEYLEKAKLSSFKKWDFLHRKGLSLFKMKQYSNAIQLYIVAISFLEQTNTPDAATARPTAYGDLANVYCSNGDREKAMPLFEKAISLCKDQNESPAETGQINHNYEECKKR